MSNLHGTATSIDEVLGQTFDTREIIDLIANLTDIADDELNDDDERQDARDELARVQPFADELADYAADYEYGEQVIRDDYFETYAQDLAEDIGAVDSDATWPNTCIDWAHAARELQYDYSAISFNGETYWVR